MTEHANNQAFTRVPRWTAPSAREEGTGVHGTRLPESLTRALEGRAAELGTGLPALLTAAHARVLATVTAERDLLVGYVPQDGAGASRPLRLSVENSTWAELAARVTATPAARGASDPVEGRPEVVLDLSGLSETAEPARTAASDAAPRAVGEVPVLRVVWSRDEYGLALRLLHDRAVLDGNYAERLAGYHLAALRLLAAGPGERHHRQSLLSDREVEKQLYGLAGPRAELPGHTFVDVFEERVRAVPDGGAADPAGTR